MKKSISQKYKDIAYPIFTLKDKPYELTYTATSIYCKKYDSSAPQLLDDKTIEGDYLSRLLKLENRVVFDYTCLNTQQLLLSRSAWGIDAKAKIHNLSIKEYAYAEIRPITRIKNNLVWLKNISYPFEIPTKENIRLGDDIYAMIVHINGEWYLKEFTLERKLNKPLVTV